MYVASSFMVAARGIARYHDSFGGEGCFVGDGGAMRRRDAVPLSGVRSRVGVVQRHMCGGAAAKTRAAIASSSSVTARGGRSFHTRVRCQARRLARQLARQQLLIGGSGMGPLASASS